MIKCHKDKWKHFYIGETDNEMRMKITQHRGYVNNKHIKLATGHHYNFP